jgi:phosphoglycerol transferase MdoB-like AlkP superfamily enzyme
MKLLRRFVLSFGPLAPVMTFVVFALAMLSASRLLLVAWQWSRVTAVDGLWSVLAFGLRFDVIVCCWFIALPVVISLLLPAQETLQRIWRPLESGWLALLAGLLIYMEAATPSFINQYDTRPNQIFYEYLNSPGEVFSTLWADYKLQLFIGAALLLAAIVLIWILCRRLQGQYRNWAWWQRLLVLPLAALLIFLGARSSLDHRPANISKAAFSTDQMVNRLGVNSTYSLIYAISNISNEGRAERIYPKMDQALMLEQIRAEMGLPETAFPSTEIPTLHHQIPLMKHKRPLNIVIILEESLGADFVGALGGEDLTPNLERLSKQGLWLTHLYATGTRSVRGIEATTTGFPPSPGRSIVKLGLAQQNFFTLAELLKKQNYSTSFIYGGESHFDNMRGFFLGNGFDKVIDQESYDAPKFYGTWGVSDQDLFDRTDQELRAAGDKPFFALVFTSSNHPPFDIPAGVVPSSGGENGKLADAVHYADYALGEFLDRARTAPYAENTVFVVVADHQDSVSGDALVPIEGFHIPGLFIGPGVPVGHYDKIASQLDLPVTLLSLAGIESDHPMIGRDLLQVASDDPGRAIMQFHLNHATMVGDQVVIHQPNLPPKSFRYTGGQLQPVADDPLLLTRSSALALWPSFAYFKQQYRLPKE